MQRIFGSNRSFLAALTTVVIVLLQLTPSHADVYLHNPRGSNNRLNEQTATRTNNNRVFDSQNNARGGYNVGDRSANAAGNTANPFTTLAQMYDPAIQNVNAQYPMVYYESSVLPVEWTNQHGCGGNEDTDPTKTNCDMVIQYMCETGYGDANIIRGAEVLRDGTTTNSPTAPQTYDFTVDGTGATTQQNTNAGVVRHESENFYYECANRRRNQGLFTADQNLATNRATSTRQNPNGAKSGLECPEERDYYPYWSPSPWKDVAILTDDDEKCAADGTFAGASQNNNLVYRCEPTNTTDTTNADTVSRIFRQITQATCVAAGGQWKAYTHGLPAPQCLPAPWTRTNHLGNTENGTTATYTWTLPSITTLSTTGVKTTTSGGQAFAKCVMRMRYNISTDDYNPDTITAASNGNASPVRNNPRVAIGAANGQRLALNVNTAQFGRTFEDRTHTFYVVSRPAAFASATIYNLNVRGKRGNIVQTYPAVEYDFTPRVTSLKATDLVHVQWTGSNTHNNNAPGGDGQTGDAGQGKSGTDRSNFAQLLQYGANYPLTYDKYQDNMFSRSTCYLLNGTVYGPNAADTTAAGTMGPRATDCAVHMFTSGYYLGAAKVQAAQTGGATTVNQNLDNAPASLVGGMVMKFSGLSSATTATTYPFFASRNNAFSNRAQKGFIQVNP